MEKLVKGYIRLINDLLLKANQELLYPTPTKNWLIINFGNYINLKLM